MKQNCWEYKNCGREPGGDKAKDLGICPAAVESRLNAVNSGRNGGRACWAITGTLCGGKIEGTFATKLGNCMQCQFYSLVVSEEGPGLQTARHIMAKLQ